MYVEDPGFGTIKHLEELFRRHRHTAIGATLRFEPLIVVRCACKDWTSRLTRRKFTGVFTATSEVSQIYLQLGYSSGPLFCTAFIDIHASLIKLGAMSLQMHTRSISSQEISYVLTNMFSSHIPHRYQWLAFDGYVVPMSRDGMTCTP